MTMHLPLAIVVVTHNRRDTLLHTLAQLHRLEADYPIVVVDNASTDGTAAAVRRLFPRARLIRRPRNVGAVARNDGVAATRHPFVAFADDDSWWAEGALTRAVTCFRQHPRLGLIMSRILVGPEERLDPCCELMSRTPLPPPPNLPGYPILGFVACGAVVRRAAFLSAGGFHPRYGTSGEEALLSIDMAHRGWRLAYLPEVISHHHPSSKRSMHGRYVDGVCHALWTAWLRRPLRRAAAITRTFLRDALHDEVARRGLLAALRGLPWVVRARVPVSSYLENQLCLLEAQQAEE